MKETVVAHYSWLDIIEPTQLESGSYGWGYYLLVILMIILVTLLSRYFIHTIRFKLWFLSYKLLKNGDVRLHAKEVLNLFSEKLKTDQSLQMTYVSQKSVIDECLLELSEASYAKNTLSSEKVQTVLGILKNACVKNR